MSNKKKRKKKSNLSGEKRKQKLLKDIREIKPDAKMIWGDENNKLSEKVINLAEPLLDQCKSFEMKKKALIAAIIAWNISLLPEKESVRAKLDFAEKTGKGNTRHIKESVEMLDFLQERKNLYFKDDERFILSYNFTKTKSGNIHLDVAYPLK